MTANHDGVVCRDPATGEHLGEIPFTPTDEQDARTRAATAASRVVRRQSPQARRTAIAIVIEELAGQQDELCRLYAHTTGKTMRALLAHEFIPGLYALTRSRVLPEALDRSDPPGLHRATVGPHTPLYDLLRGLAGALHRGLGLTVTLDPSTSWSSLAGLDVLQALLRKAGLPLELVTWTITKNGDLPTPPDPTLGVALVDPGAWAMGTPQMLVHEGFVAGRPGRIRPTTVLVHQRHTNALLDRLASGIRHLHQGSPIDPVVDVGALPSPSVSALNTRVTDATNRGAQAVVGGHLRSSTQATGFYAPTLLAPCDPSMAITHAADPGPVMSVVPYPDHHGLVALLRMLPTKCCVRLFGSAHADIQRTQDALDGRAATVIIENRRACELWAALTGGHDGYARLEAATRLRFSHHLRPRSRALLDSARLLAHAIPSVIHDA